MSYEFKLEDVYDFLSTNGIGYREKGEEIEAKYCPYCHGGERRDDYTFAINKRKGVYKCLRSSCGQCGHFVELARDFGYELDFGKPKIYRDMKQLDHVIVPTNRAVEYLESRGIPKEITEKYQVTTTIKNPNVLAFPFFDEQGKLQFAKYRDTMWQKGCGHSKEWCEKDAMPILFGMKQCTDFGTLVVTEGQIDALSVAAAGYPNCVSVPMGCNGWTWLPFCLEWMEKFREVVVFGDWEHGKMTLLDKLKSTLNTVVKAVRKEDYLGEKDANDILRNFGTQAIKKAVDRAELPRMDNVKDLATVESVNLNDIAKIKTGIAELDRVIGGMCMGQVILLTGKRGSGKSTLMSQFVASALDQKESVFVYSGELADFHFKRWLDYQLCGQENVTESENEYGDKMYSIPEDVEQAINDWYRGRAYIYDNEYIPDENSELGTISDTIVRVIKEYGTRLICIDNLMTAMDVVTVNDNLFLAQSNFVGKLKAIAMKYQVSIILVAHPRKSQGDFSNDDVSGSSDITNKVDVVLNYSRAQAEESDAGGRTDSLLQVTKNRLFGTLLVDRKTDAIKLAYSKSTKRITSINDNWAKVYGWKQIWEPKVITDDFELPF